MFDPDNGDHAKPPRSLLALSGAAETPAHERASRSRESDPALRHRLARSRRQATPSPLLSALSASRQAVKDDAESPTPAGTQETNAPDGKPAADASRRYGRLGKWSPSRLRSHDGEVAEDAERAEPTAPAPPTRAAVQPVAVVSADDPYWRPLIDPVKIFGGISRSRHIIVATTILGAALGVFIALNTPKKYESVAEILVDPRNLRIVDSDLTQSGLSAEATLAVVENQVRVITSGAVLAKVVDKLNLAADPEFNGEGSDGFGIGAIISELRSILSRRDSAGGGDVRYALAIQNLAESLEVERGGKTFVVSVGAVTEDPDKSALIANTVTEVFLQAYGSIQSGTAGRASDELTSRLSELQAGVEEAERDVEAFKSENDLIDAQGRLISDDEMVKLNEQLTVARARTIELNARAASARDVDVDEVLAGNLPEQIASPVMAQLRSQYATLKQEADRLAVRLGPRHPERLAAEAQLAGAREGLQAELRRVVASIQVELKRAVQLEQDLAARLAQLKVRQSNVSEDLVTLRELEREAATKRTVYESFLLRARETSEQSGMNTANISVISEAQPPLKPLGPSRSMITIAATAIGFLAGIAIGATRGAADSLREGGARTPLRPAPARPARAAARREQDAADEIDRIMRSASDAAPARPASSSPAGRRTASSSTATESAAASAPTTYRHDHGSEESDMHPFYPYAYDQAGRPYAPRPPHPQQPVYPQSYAPRPQAWPAQHPGIWQDPHAAAWAQQQAMHQAWSAHNGYAQPPAWGWPQPAAAPAYSETSPVYAPSSYAYPPPQPAQSYPQRPQPSRRTESAPGDLSAVDEIRQSLREFREAVRDLTDRRGGTRDW